MLRFVKMHGCGNDYIFIDCIKKRVKKPGELAVKLSDRHIGIGGDGIVLIMPSETADVRMRIFNMDGSEAEMCGNAIRCVGKYFYERKLTNNTNIKVQTKSGIKELFLSVKNGKVSSVKVNMGRTKVIAEDKIVTYISVGNPHAVVFCESVDSIDVNTLGGFFEKNPAFKNMPAFSKGINTEFVQVTGRNCLKMRVHERGSGETQGCGTGACAAAAAAVLYGYCDKNTDITARLPGGELTINLTDNGIYMTGNCVKVFEGVL